MLSQAGSRASKPGAGSQPVRMFRAGSGGHVREESRIQSTQWDRLALAEKGRLQPKEYHLDSLGVRLPQRASSALEDLNLHKEEIHCPGGLGVSFQKLFAPQLAYEASGSKHPPFMGVLIVLNGLSCCSKGLGSGSQEDACVMRFVSTFSTPHLSTQSLTSMCVLVGL